MRSDSLAPLLNGTVEVDETYVGGKPRNRIDQANRTLARIDGKSVRPWSTKKPVVALLERGGSVRAFPIDKVTGETLTRIIHENVDQEARLITDELHSYRQVGKTHAGGHDRIHHGRGEYVRGDVTTNTVEGFFNLLKRGLIGTFHQVSKKHLHRYLSEFEFRYNTRKIDDVERTKEALRHIEGKRLTYYKAMPCAG